MSKLERLNSVSVMTSNVGSTHMTPREDYVRLSDAITYGDQRAAEAREQMREECIVTIESKKPGGRFLSKRNTNKLGDLNEVISAIKEIP